MVAIKDKKKAKGSFQTQSFKMWNQSCAMRYTVILTFVEVGILEVWEQSLEEAPEESPLGQ
jgi:hypothetical protein